MRRKVTLGWKPSSPGNEIVREVETFTAAVRRIGYAAPEQIDDYLRQGMKAFLGGDYATARAIYQALLPPIAEADIDLGQHELVDEVLTVRVHDCAAQYLVTVYAATPLEARPEALWRAIGAVDGISTFWEPFGEMGRVAPEPLPELDAFLPRWLARVEREPSSENEWEDHRDRWLQEAAERLEGVAGLARLARQTGRPRCLQRGCRGCWEVALARWISRRCGACCAAARAARRHQVSRGRVARRAVYGSPPALARRRDAERFNAGKARRSSDPELPC